MCKIGWYEFLVYFNIVQQVEEGAELLSGGQVLLGVAAAGELLAPSGKWEIIGQSEYPLLRDDVF